MTAAAALRYHKISRCRRCRAISAQIHTLSFLFLLIPMAIKTKTRDFFFLSSRCECGATVKKLIPSYVCVCYSGTDVYWFSSCVDFRLTDCFLTSLLLSGRFALIVLGQEFPGFRRLFLLFLPSGKYLVTSNYFLRAFFVFSDSTFLRMCKCEDSG